MRTFYFKCIWTFCLLFIFSHPLFSQNRKIRYIDSLNNLAESCRYTAPYRSAEIAKQAIRLSGNTPGLKKQKVLALVNWSYALAESGALDSSSILADSARYNSTGIADSSVSSALFVLQGYICDFQEKNDEALRYYFEGLSVCPDLKHRAAICNNIGTVYKMMQDLGNAEKYYEMSYAIGEQQGDSVRLARCLNNLGGVFYSRHDYAGALKRYKLSLQIRESQHDSVGMSSSISNIAMIYEELDKPDSALLLYRRSLELGMLSKRPVDLIVSRINIGNILFRLKQKPEAFRELQMAANLSDSLHFHYYSRLAHRSLANYYYKTGDYRQAYDNYVLYSAYNDSVLTEHSQKNTQELELRYRTRESAQQIKLLGEQKKAAVLENENNENQIGRQRNMLWILVLIAIAIVLLAALLFQRYRAERKHAGELQKLVSEKDLLLREIHHRVKNNLQLVSSLLSLQDANSEGSGSQNLLQNQERIHTLSLLHEQLYRSSDLKAISFREYVKLLLEHISNSFSKAGSSIQMHCEVEDAPFDIDQLVPCGLIVNELVTNCFKYAFPSGKGTVTVSMKREGHDCVLVVSDDGVGMPHLNGERKTLGLRLVEGLCRQLRGKLESESVPGIQTKFRIIFPLKIKEGIAA